MKLPIKKAGSAFALLAGVLAISGPAGCFALGNNGLEPPLREFYYPTAIVTSPGQKALYVINSDFDIQYTGGTVQALDLTTLRRCLGPVVETLAAGKPAAQACAHLDTDPTDESRGLNQNPVLYPGPCRPIDVAAETVCSLDGGEVAGPVIRSSHIIGAFASAATLIRNPAPVSGEPGARLFVSVRGDPSVTYFDLSDDARTPDGNPFSLDCKVEGALATDVGGTCGTKARIGVSKYQSSRELTMPVEPVGIAGNDDGFAIVTVHQTDAAASLVVNPWSGVRGPSLEFTATGLPNGPTEIAAIPTPGYIRAANAEARVVDYRPGFLVTFRAATGVDLLRFYDDGEATSRHFLQRIASYSINSNSDGSDSRGIAIDDSERKACEADCAAGDLDCLRECIETPLEVFVANRSPASLLTGTLTTTLIEENGVVTGANESVLFNDMVPLSSGPSRVAVGRVLDREGRSVPRVFVVSFDSRYVAIYDPQARRIEGVVRTGRGPHALAFDVSAKSGTDGGHAYLYVAHFTDSYVGVVDLDTRNAQTFGSMFATVGTPTPPKDAN